jgi:hypothetical protein
MSSFTLNDILANASKLLECDEKYQDILHEIQSALEMTKQYNLLDCCPINRDTQLTNHLLVTALEENLNRNESSSNSLEMNYQKYNLLKEMLLHLDAISKEPACHCDLFEAMKYLVSDKHHNSKQKSKSKYVFYDQMDEPNKKAMDVWENKGMEAAVEHMTAGLRNGTMSYAQMRALYG